MDESEGSPAGTCDPLCSVDEMSSVDFEANYKPNSDIIKAVSVGALALGTTAIVQHSWVAENQVSQFVGHSILYNCVRVPLFPLRRNSTTKYWGF